MTTCTYCPAPATMGLFYDGEHYSKATPACSPCALVHGREYDKRIMLAV